VRKNSLVNIAGVSSNT